MNKSLLQTYVRSALTPEPQTAEDIANKLLKQFPDVTVGRVQIILNQLYQNGLCGAAGPFGQGPQSFFDFSKKSKI